MTISLNARTTGGLLVDFGVLTLRPGVLSSEHDADTDVPNVRGNIPRLPPSHPAVVEWRAMTVIELCVITVFVCQSLRLMTYFLFRDRIAEGLRRKYNLSRETLTLAQVLESATWKGGREIAKKLRPATGGPPIDVISDGTVF